MAQTRTRRYNSSTPPASALDCHRKACAPVRYHTPRWRVDRYCRRRRDRRYNAAYPQTTERKLSARGTAPTAMAPGSRLRSLRARAIPASPSSSMRILASLRDRRSYIRQSGWRSGSRDFSGLGSITRRTPRSAYDCRWLWSHRNRQSSSALTADQSRLPRFPCAVRRPTRLPMGQPVVGTILAMP